MIYHVLPGDAQVEDFRQIGLQGELLVCREALIQGDISGETLDEFFNDRAAFLGESDSNYDANVASQFRPLLNVGSADEVNLWFEYELFCAVNMWFCLSLLLDSDADIYRVAPVHLSFEDRWDGFGNTNPEILKRCYADRVKLSKSDIELGAEVWNAFRRRDADELLHLTLEPQTAFPYLDEVGRAAANIDTKPLETVREIKREGKLDLAVVFPEFRRRAGVYGFGDTQVKRLMEEK
jgi:hypothetical protein